VSEAAARSTWGRRGIVLLACLVLLTITALALGWFPQEPLRRVVEKRIRAAVGPQARLGHLVVRPLFLEATIDDLVFPGTGYRIDVPRMRVVLSPESLLMRTLSLASLELYAPRITVQVLPGGGSSAAPAPSLPPIVARHLLVTGGTLKAVVPDEGDIVFRGIEARGGIGTGALDLSVAGGSWDRLGAGPVPIGPSRARLTVSPLLDLRLDSLEATMGLSRVRASGSLGHLGFPSPDVDLEARLDLSEATSLGAPPMAGILEGRGHWKGRGAAARGQGTLRGTGLLLGGWRVDHAEVALGQQADRTQASLSLVLLGGHVHGEASVQGSSADVTVKVGGVEVNRLGRAAGLAGMPLQGTLDADLRLDGNLDRALRLKGSFQGAARAKGGPAMTLKGDADGALDVPQKSMDLQWRTQISLQGEGAGPAQVLSADFRIEGTARGPLPPSLEGRLTGTVTLGGTYGPQEVSLEGTATAQGRALTAHIGAQGFGGTLDGTLEWRGAYLTRLAAQGRGLKLEGLLAGVAGVLDLDLEASGPPDRLSSSGHADLKAASWQGIPVGTLRLAWVGSDGRGHVSAQAPAVGVTGDGDVRWGPHPAVQGTLTLAATPLDSLARFVPGNRPIAGAVSGGVRIDAPLNAPRQARLEAHVQSVEIQTGGIRLSAARPFDLALRDGQLSVAGLDLQGSGLSLQATGSFGADLRAPLDVHATARVDLGAVSPLDVKPKGTLEADVSLLGTLERPRVRGVLKGTDVTAEVKGLPLALTGLEVDLLGEEASVAGLTVAVAGGLATLAGTIPNAVILRAIRGQRDAPATKEEARLRLAWSGIAASTLLKAFKPETPPVLDAILSGEALLEGGLTFADSRVSVSIPTTTLKVADLDVDLAPVTVRMVEGRFTTEGVTFKAGGGSFRAEGWADLAKRSLDVTGKGTLDLRALSPFLAPAASLTGTSDVDLRIRGAFDALRSEGTLALRDGVFRLKDFPNPVTSIDIATTLQDTTLRIDRATAMLGGGTVTASGSATLAGGGVSGVGISLSGRDMGLRYPPGLKSRIDADLSLTGKTGAFLLSGTVKAVRGLYDIDLAIQENLSTPLAPPSESPLLKSVALDIRIETTSPILVRNNVARLEATGNLTLRGDLQDPAPFGRLELQRDGVVYLQGQDFTIQSGGLAYDGSWNPDISVSARRAIRDANVEPGASPGTASSGNERNVDVTVEVQGRLDDPKLQFQTQQDLNDSQILALIATGNSKSKANEAAFAGGLAASLVLGRLGQSLFRGIGLGDVSVRPELLARETNSPGARFTFGKQLSPRLGLIYSLGLNDSEQKFFLVEAKPFRTVGLSLERRDDGTVTYAGGQRLRWGDVRQEVAVEEGKRLLQDVRFEGDVVSPGELLNALHAHPGARLSPFDLQDDADRIRNRLLKTGYLEASVGARLEGDTAIIGIHAGALYRWRVEGMVEPKHLEREIKKALFEEEALARGRELLLRELRDQGHLRATVTAEGADTEGGRILSFKAVPGLRVGSTVVRFPGATTLSESLLLEAAGGPAAFLVSPDDAVKAVEALYRRRHFLGVRVGSPVVEEAGAAVRVSIRVEEGPPAKIAWVRFEGTSLPTPELKGVAKGAVFSEAAVAAGVATLRDRYLKEGYAAVRVAPSLVPEGTDLGVLLRVSEGERTVMGSLRITGLTRTRESLVRGRVDLKPGDPVDPRRLTKIERRLLDLGIFSSVVVTASRENPATIEVSLREGPALTAGYDVRYNDKDRFTTLVDAEEPNVFGRGVAIGGRYRRGSLIEEERGSLHVPAVGPGDLIASAYRTREDLGPTLDPQSGDTVDSIRITKGFGVQENLSVANRWNLLCGYEYRRLELTLFPIPETVASLKLSVFGDTRDDILDPRRGRFLSLTLQYSPKFLGSDFTFVKGFAQASLVRSVGSSWTWAQAYRLGLAKGFGGQRLVLRGDPFMAGGAESLRGFVTDSVGPRDFLGRPTGGEAEVILNQEMRYRHPSGLGAVFFYDGGNIFSTLSDFSFHLRHDLGLGLRFDSPVGLLRIDVGFPLARREGEKAYHFSLSLGQAF
jgi:translocation and assembly module TamA